VDKEKGAGIRRKHHTLKTDKYDVKSDVNGLCDPKNKVNHIEEINMTKVTGQAELEIGSQ